MAEKQIMAWFGPVEYDLLIKLRQDLKAEQSEVVKMAVQLLYTTIVELKSRKFQFNNGGSPMSSVKVTVEGNELVVRLPLNPQPSKSGKTVVVSSTHGNKQTDAEYNGKRITVGCNAYISK